MPDTAASILEDLTGQKQPFAANLEEAVAMLLGGSGLGHSQLNELLLTYGYDRVSTDFFQYLIDSVAQKDGRDEETATENRGDEGLEDDVKSAAIAFHSLTELRRAVDRFREWAVLRFGNVKYAFKYLSKLDEDNFALELELLKPTKTKDFASRHDPLVPIDPIPAADTYYLGYLIHRKLKERVAANANDEDAKSRLAKREEVVKKGRKNHEAYLASDHMDVYVATSMREAHEYQAVSKMIADVFQHDLLKTLKVRWFDPTQAYCEDRIDKGLVEALMLRRAMCTLYLAQEVDTLGKDSELASTLAQGKPVIAYVPEVKESEQTAYTDALLLMVGGDGGDRNINVMLDQLRVFAPDAAWKDPEVQAWVREPTKADAGAAKAKLAKCVRAHYDIRAKILKESHPLGLQVNLETGVANGVLVARTPEQCSKLIYRVLTNRLSFKLSEESGSLLLREELTGSVFRVVTADKFLTNSFWNFYTRDLD